jgi:glucosylceramidase
VNKDGATIGIMPVAPIPTPTGQSKGTAQLVQSAEDTLDRLSTKEDVVFYNDFSFEGPVVDVSSTELDQEIEGFGGAFTEASALVFQDMTKQNQEQLIEKYFDPENGIGYTVGRVHINSCDFSPAPAQWTEDDVDGDYNLDHFDNNVTRDRKAMIPLILQGKKSVEASGRKLKLFASPWSPPAWMKTNGQMVGGGSLKPECKASWANYFVKWLDAYKSAGVDFWAVTPQNEPENPAGWEACVFSADEQADWIGSELGPQLKAAHPEVLIFPFDHNKDHVHLWADTMYSHPSASQYIAGIAFHWYSGDEFDHVAQVHQKYPKATLLPSEATWEKYRWSKRATVESGEWSFGEGYGHDILGDLNQGACGWTDWNMLLDQTGGPNHLGNNCDAPMFADNDKQELYLHPQYYYIGHFSKYLVPGSRRILSSVSGSTAYSGPGRGYGTCTAEDGLQATAFQRPDGTVAVVVLNCGAMPLNFKLKDAGRAAAVQIPGNAIQTFTFSRAVVSPGMIQV